MECYHQSRRYLIELESELMIRRNRIHLRKRYFNPKNDTNSTEPSNYLDDSDVKNNEPNDDSDDEVGNNFNRAVTARVKVHVVNLDQRFSNHGSPRLCGWVAKACKLPRVKEKICAHKISEVKNLFKRSLQF